MKKVYINGYFTKEHMNGAPRYAMEIVKRLDNYFKPGEAELVIPFGATNIPPVKNIKICSWEDRGRKREINGQLWGDLSYGPYVRKKHGLSINMTNRAEWVRDSLTMLHDTISLESSKYKFIKDNFRLKIFRILNFIWYRHKVFVKKHTAYTIVTVSDCAKSEICSRLGFDADKVRVIGNGWEHLNDIAEKDEQLNYKIKTNQFYFFVGNIKPHKNIQWILEEAKTMPNEYFVIAGKIPDEIVGLIKEKNHNILFLPHISDGYMKWLMMHCKALLFPSRLEGFGLPPLEALALGTKAIVADIPVMHEIYDDCVYYINPDNGSYDLNALIKEPVGNVAKILEKHSWDKSAKEWIALIKETKNIL